MSERKLPFRVVYASSEDPDNPASELDVHSSHTRGWQSARFCDWPQELGLELLDGPCAVSQLQLLSHQCKIATRIELYVGTGDDYRRCEFVRLGYLSLDSNEASSYKARELKSVYVKARGNFVKLLLHRCYVNAPNLFNQVGLVAVNVLGSGPGGAPGPAAAAVVPAAARRDRYAAPRTGAGPGVHADLAVDMSLDPETAALLREVAARKEAAVLSEDFALAKRLKALQESVAGVGATLRELSDDKARAVACEDYDAAGRLKSEIAGIRAELGAQLAHVGIAPAGASEPLQPAARQRQPQSSSSGGGGGGAQQQHAAAPPPPSRIPGPASASLHGGAAPPAASGSGDIDTGSAGPLVTEPYHAASRARPAASILVSGGSDEAERVLGEYDSLPPQPQPQQQHYRPLSRAIRPAPTNALEIALARSEGRQPPVLIAPAADSQPLSPSASAADQQQHQRDRTLSGGGGGGGGAASVSAARHQAAAASAAALLAADERPLPTTKSAAATSSGAAAAAAAASAAARGGDAGVAAAGGGRVPDDADDEAAGASAPAPGSASGGPQPLPEPEPLSPAAERELAALIPLFGEHAARCIGSRAWQLREAGIAAVAAELPAAMARAATAAAAASSSSGGGGGPAGGGPLQVAGAVLALIGGLAAREKIAHVYVAVAGKLLPALLAASPPSVTRPQLAHGAFTPLTLELLERLGDNVARTREAAVGGVLELASCEALGPAFVVHAVLARHGGGGGGSAGAGATAGAGGGRAAAAAAAAASGRAGGASAGAGASAPMLSLNLRALQTRLELLTALVEQAPGLLTSATAGGGAAAPPHHSSSAATGAAAAAAHNLHHGGSASTVPVEALVRYCADCGAFAHASGDIRRCTEDLFAAVHRRVVRERLRGVDLLQRLAGLLRPKQLLEYEAAFAAAAHDDAPQPGSSGGGGSAGGGSGGGDRSLPAAGRQPQPQPQPAAASRPHDAPRPTSGSSRPTSSGSTAAAPATSTAVSNDARARSRGSSAGSGGGAQPQPQQQPASKPHASSSAAAVPAASPAAALPPPAAPPARDSDDEPHAGVCQFCGGDQGAGASEAAMDLHYYSACPLLMPCGSCGQVVEIAAVHEHLLSECERRGDFAACPACAEAVPVAQLRQHQAAAGGACRPPPAGAGGTTRCPLCHADVSDFVGHMTDALRGCPANPRRGRAGPQAAGGAASRGGGSR